MIRINKTEYNDAKKRIRSFIKDHHRLPNYVTFKTQTGKRVNLKHDEYCGLFQGYMQFYQKHGREPNYLTLNTEATYPLVINYQDDPYSCGVASLQMCLQFLFDYQYESKIKKTLGTNKDGTTPTQLINGAKKLGYKVTIIPREFKEVKKALDSYKPVILQIETKSAGNCLSYKNSYGHYIMCYKADTNKYYVMDPTKGPKVCNSTTLNKATGGSKHRKFYSVEML